MDPKGQCTLSLMFTAPIVSFCLSTDVPLRGQLLYHGASRRFCTLFRSTRPQWQQISPAALQSRPESVVQHFDKCKECLLSDLAPRQQSSTFWHRSPNVLSSGSRSCSQLEHTFQVGHFLTLKPSTAIHSLLQRYDRQEADNGSKARNGNTRRPGPESTSLNSGPKLQTSFLESKQTPWWRFRLRLDLLASLESSLDANFSLSQLKARKASAVIPDWLVSLRLL